MKRKGYALLEMIGILGVLVTLLAILAKPTKTLVADVHRMHRDFSAYSNMSIMLRELRKDIENAVAVESTQTNLLVIKNQDYNIQYKFDTDEIVKQIITDGSMTADTPIIWIARHATITLKLHEKNGITEVVQVDSGIVRKQSGRLEKRFFNNN